MSETNTVEPITKLDAIQITGTQRSVFLELCDGMVAADRGKARVYGRAFEWASGGDWDDWDDWANPETGKHAVPSALLGRAYQLDADKKQKKAITTIIVDALGKGILPGATLRKLDRIYRQIEGESLVSED